eukprot:scaffold3348_cov74-Cylindrotheca_fusiformis.AAC.6
MRVDIADMRVRNASILRDSGCILSRRLPDSINVAASLFLAIAIAGSMVFVDVLSWINIH